MPFKQKANLPITSSRFLSYKTAIKQKKKKKFFYLPLHPHIHNIYRTAVCLQKNHPPQGTPEYNRIPKQQYFNENFVIIVFFL